MNMRTGLDSADYGVCPPHERPGLEAEKRPRRADADIERVEARDRISTALGV